MQIARKNQQSNKSEAGISVAGTKASEDAQSSKAGMALQLKLIKSEEKPKHRTEPFAQ
jgi:hypothetical protein